LFLITDFAILRVKDHPRESIAGERHVLTLECGLPVQEYTAGRVVITTFQNRRASSFTQMPFFLINSSDNYQSNKRVQKSSGQTLKEEMHSPIVTGIDCVIP
jgi:hypothetical protein